jgi:hypothetical protein
MDATMMVLWRGAYCGARALDGINGVYSGARALDGTNGLPAQMGWDAEHLVPAAVS